MKFFNFQFPISDKNGFTFIEAIIGVALMLIVFMGIFGAYRLALKVVGLSKNKIIATGIANSQIEKIRNLPYASVGIVNASLPKASGIIPAVAAQNIDGGTFTITTNVQFMVDPLQIDGTVTGNSCDWDYKNASVKVTWSGDYAGSITLSTVVAPKSIVEETQTCQSQPGGVITATVFDSQGVLVPSALISVYDAAGSVLYDTATPSAGSYSFALPAGTYRVIATKSGYSVARSYGTNEVATPITPNPTVIVGGNTPVSLSIDTLSTVLVDAVSPTGQDNFADSFIDQSKISAVSGVQVAAGSVDLAGPPYASNGFAVSSAIAPTNIVSWGSFNFTDSQPVSTGVSYQILYYNGASWVPVPNQDLGGNSSGFTSSPVDLSGLSATTYPQLKISGTLTSADVAKTPSILNWQIIWTTNTGAPIAGADFHMQGNKTIGKDASGQNVFKSVNDYSTDVTGQLSLPNTEWDTYNFSPSASSTLNLIGIAPAPQPVSVPPNSAVTVNLYLKATNALLVTVQDDQSLSPVFSASIELKNGSVYDKTQYADQKGQTYFAPLSAGTYSLTVQSSGYNSYSGGVVVSGQSVNLVNLHQIQ
jgi:hypothetical protein